MELQVEYRGANGAERESDEDDGKGRVKIGIAEANRLFTAQLFLEQLFLQLFGVLFERQRSWTEIFRHDDSKSACYTYRRRRADIHVTVISLRRDRAAVRYRSPASSTRLDLLKAKHAGSICEIVKTYHRWVHLDDDDKFEKVY